MTRFGLLVECDACSEMTRETVGWGVITQNYQKGIQSFPFGLLEGAVFSPVLREPSQGIFESLCGRDGDVKLAYSLVGDCNDGWKQEF